MEHDVFYPWIEKNLTKQELNEIIKKLKNIYII
jgi:hemolysin activation/secretion protein